MSQHTLKCHISWSLHPSLCRNECMQHEAIAQVKIIDIFNQHPYQNPLDMKHGQHVLIVQQHIVP